MVGLFLGGFVGGYGFVFCVFLVGVPGWWMRACMCGWFELSPATGTPPRRAIHVLLPGGVIAVGARLLLLRVQGGFLAGLLPASILAGVALFRPHGSSQPDDHISRARRAGAGVSLPVRYAMPLAATVICHEV